MAPIRLGVVGLSAQGSWASRSHLKHLQQSADYTITALQNSSKQAAQAAVEKYNLPADTTACYDDIESLVHDANVDMVIVSVKVPEHYALIKPALEARKDIFVEWPLAANLQQAEELTALATAHKVRTMVGLQARQNPSIRRAREMVSAGKLGEILGTTMLGSGMIFGPTTTPGMLYTLPLKHGANLITIPAGHAMDALCWVLGELADVQATLANNRPELLLVDGSTSESKPKPVPKTAHDYMALTGHLVKGGGVATVVYQGGTSVTGKDFYWEINGTKGSLVLEADKGHVQMFHPTLKFVKAEPGAKLDEVLVDRADDLSYNVGLAWDAFVDKGPGSVTTFEDALLRHKMIDAIYRSNEKGTRETYI
ncbi:hypothetical protein A1O1_07782 [Capronia coronata CBS 617.96]|uniref:Gfo/Idh/MocA-like oxidoreductase N-terminal domain-containing protein n=1 Tax=Capronia coronata CBS 617.96 TaxID=1182541 RepID=W9XME8_9EURO|nr:uncharacterized protein A1O1_07782 [Capronia coronata CBS 617.96]EXJ81717.1 hypothetical protein A1O1_07782 [Capronia coronata CBS 617.96]